MDHFYSALIASTHSVRILWERFFIHASACCFLLTIA